MPSLFLCGAIRYFCLSFSANFCCVKLNTALNMLQYNQHANISHNTIVQSGGSAIAFWGNSSGSHPAQPPGTGPDGTQGNYPRHNLVEGNFITQLGIHAKQSACFFQAKSAQTTLRRNLCFDVPRAGFNLNDGFGSFFVPLPYMHMQGQLLGTAVLFWQPYSPVLARCRWRQQHQRELALPDVWRVRRVTPLLLQYCLTPYHHYSRN